jgi:hypothetical protein
MVLYGTRSGVYTNQIDVGAVTQFQVPSLADNTAYFFSVKAYNSAGLQSNASTEVSTTTPPTPIVPAQNLGFSGTGKPSLIWQSPDGSLEAWFLNGITATAQMLTPTGVADPAWQVVGAADFNNNGFPDLLFQNAVTGALAAWMMNGTTMVSASLLSPTGPTDPNWRIVGIADFNADGRPDLLFQHATSGALAVWYMNGLTMIGAAMLSPTGPVDPAWKVVAVTDFNADGKPDILFQNATTSALVIWYMNRLQLTSATLLSPNGPTDVDWKVAAVTDVNNDGKPDLVFQHRTSGQVVVWYMNGAAMTSGAFLTPAGANISWKVKAIR